MQDLTSRRRLAAGLLFWACLPAVAELPEPVAGRLRAAGLTADSMAAIVVNARTGETVASHRARESLAPASTLKPLTAIVALEKLGPAWRGRTQMVTSAAVTDGVLQGDLVLRGGADADFDWVALQRMLLVLRNKGIREIAGDLVLDRSFFTPARIDQGLPPFDEEPEFRYNVIPDALPVNMHLAGLEMESDGRGLRVSLQPPLAGVSVESAMTLADMSCEKWEDTWKSPDAISGEKGEVRIRLKGRFPKDCSASTRIAVLDRTDYIDRLFRALWQELGGSLRGSTREAAQPGGRLLAEHQSRTLAELTRDINKRSDNPITRLVYLALGTLDEGPPGGTTTERAERVVRAWLKAKGIDDQGLVLDNGSGLSRKERIRPDQLARVLLVARTSPWAPEFVSAFPIAGVDGGLRKRLASLPAAKPSRLKTGTLRNASALAGYVETSTGETLVVVAMINHDLATGAVARPILDAYIDAVARSAEAAAGRRSTAGS
jgi:D-alanyl-D-alanine carboxypeptidase/D-alanyl-D-alanine-endopeptidase (penicillin-binding protein 4)